MCEQEIIVAFGIDSAYLPHMATTIASIIANNKTDCFRFLIIHDGISAADQRKAETVAPNQTFQWCQIVEKRIAKFGTRHHWSKAAYYRLCIPEFASENTKRVIYLDSDLVVLSNLRTLWEVDLGGRPIGAVYDIMMDSVAFASRWNLSSGRLKYFNSGVLVLDLEKIRSGNMFAGAYDLIENHWEELEYTDQCVLNILFWDNWKVLDPVWNFQRCMAIKEPNHERFALPNEIPTNRHPKIIHYTEHNKPWSVDAYHPFTWSYYKFLRRTPFWREVNKQAQTNPMKHLRRYIKTQVNFAGRRKD